MAEMQPQQAPMGAAPAAPQGNEAEQVVLACSETIQGIAEALKQVDPKAAEAMAALNQQFQQIISSVSPGGAPQAPQGSQGMVSPNAGGNPGAVPVGR